MIASYFKKLSKKTQIISTAFGAVAILLCFFIFNLENNLGFIAKKMFDINLKVENIDLSYNKIKINKVKIYDKQDRLMIDIPEAELIYSISNLKLKELNVNSPNIFIINDDNGINIKESFKGKKKLDEKKVKSNENSQEEVEKKYKPKTAPIEKINISNLLVDYKLNKDGMVAEKDFKNIFINIESEQTNGIVAKLKTSTNPENIEIVYKNKEEPLYLELKLDGIQLSNYKELIGKSKIKKIDGELKVDTIFSSKAKSGYIKLDNFNFYHSDIESEIKANVNVELDKEDIFAVIDYEIFGEKDQMEAMYKDGKLYSLVQFKNINEAKLSKIIPLKESKLDLSKINIEDIIFLTQYDVEEGFRLNFDLKPKKVQIGAISLDKMKANLIIKDGIKKLEDANIFIKIADMPAKMNLEALVDKNIADISFQIQNLDKTSDLIPNFNGSAKIENRDESIIAKIESNIINFDSDYQKETGNLKFYNKDFNLDYNRNEKKFYGDGELNFSIYGLKNNIKYAIEKDKVNFDKIKIENEKNKNESLDAKGYYDLVTKDFKFDYDSTDLEIRRYYKGQEILLSFQGKGEFERIHSVLTGIGNVKGLNLKYLGDVKSLTGQYSFGLNESNELEVEFNGKIAELDYGKYKLKDVLVKLGFEKEILNIKKMGNNFFTLSGKINKTTQESDLQLNIKNLTNTELDFNKLGFNIKDANAAIKGNLENPNVNVNINEVELLIQDKISKLAGNIKINDKKVNFHNLRLNNNKLIGNYDIQSESLDATLTLDDNVSNYIKENDIDYKLKGQISLNGVGGKINSQINISGNGKRKDLILPSTSMVATYSAKNYSDGVLNLKSLELKNDENKSLVNFKGDINLGNKTINLNSNELIDLHDLRKYIKNNEIKGELLTDIKLKGKIENPNYTVSLTSNKISFKENNITEFNSKLNGDKHSLKVENLSFKYFENYVLGSGNYNIDKKIYDFTLESKDQINLAILNKILKDKGLKDINGQADLSVGIDNKGLKGYLTIDNLSFCDEKKYVKVDNLKTDIDLKNNQVRLKEITAKVNDGDLKIEGYINIPKDFKNFTDSMDYSIDINAKDLKYNDPLIAKISADSKMNISNKKLNGELLINNGIIYDIPNDYKNMWSIISKKILNTKDKKIENEKKKIDSKKKEEGKKKLEKFFEKWNLVNFNVRTQNLVVLDIDDFNIAVGEIKGKLEADLLLTGGRGKYKIEGNTEILNGYLYVNTNKFILDRALISFNDGLSYLPEINPDIFIDSRVTMDEEDINFGVHGRLKKLMYSLSSDSGNINGSFNSLLIDSNKEVNFNGDINRVYVMFMKNIIAGQIAKTVFNPVTKEVKKVLGLSKLIIKPEVSVYNIDSRVEGNNDSGRNSEVYDLGMKVEAEKKLYKDEVYLYGTAKLWGSTKEPVINSSLDKNGIKEYDVGVQYRIKDDKIFGMGVGTIPNRYVNEDRNQKARNYHIDFKIRKKYNSFSEIFSF